MRSPKIISAIRRARKAQAEARFSVWVGNHNLAFCNGIHFSICAVGCLSGPRRISQRVGGSAVFSDVLKVSKCAGARRSSGLNLRMPKRAKSSLHPIDDAGALPHQALALPAGSLGIFFLHCRYGDHAAMAAFSAKPSGETRASASPCRAGRSLRADARARRPKARWISKGLHDRAFETVIMSAFNDVIMLMGHDTSLSMTLAIYDVAAGTRVWRQV